MPITLSDEDAAELASEIRSLMDNWNPCDNAADYMCEFCGNRPPTNIGNIVHKPDCSGQKFLNLLQKDRT